MNSSALRALRSFDEHPSEARYDVGIDTVAVVLNQAINSLKSARDLLPASPSSLFPKRATSLDFFHCSVFVCPLQSCRGSPLGNTPSALV